MTFFDDHRPMLDGALAAIANRHSWSAFADDPADHPLGDAGPGEGLAAFESHLGSRVPLDQDGTWTTQTDEISPFTRQPLGIAYPRLGADELLTRAEVGRRDWARASLETRTGVCLEILDRLHIRNFELQQASVHTTGMGPRMAYTGNGTNALDRGLEAVAKAYSMMAGVEGTATWERPFGKAISTLTKTYRTVPIGTAVAIGCASFPAWNTYPAILVNLVTGNPVVVKPHPSSVLVLAIAVQVSREVLEEAGFDPNLVTLGVDDADALIAKELVEDPRCRIVDFTGGRGFGSWLEHNLPGKAVYTETAGVNSVVLDSVGDLASAARSIAGGLCLFSAQMCTSPQNLYLPSGGVRTSDGVASREDVIDAIVTAVDAIADHPRRAAALMGAVQADTTVTIQEELQASLGASVVRPGGRYEHPEHPEARTLTPMIATVDAEDVRGTIEQFGPNSFVVEVPDSREGIRIASSIAREHGAITSYLYSTDEAVQAEAEDRFVDAGANLTVNATGPMPMNFSAAYSDYHVSGLNPAGNATLADAAFVAGRFRVAQSRIQH